MRADLSALQPVIKPGAVAYTRSQSPSLYFKVGVPIIHVWWLHEHYETEINVQHGLGWLHRLQVVCLDSRDLTSKSPDSFQEVEGR